MARDIGEWLETLGLGRYAEAFADNEIDLQALPHITEKDLKEIGVALGARRKLLAAVAELGDLERPVLAPDRSAERTAGAKAERRQLTVLFCDMVGSTAMSSRLDPEDYREIIRAYQDACAGVISRYDGYVAKFMGDGVLAYFGWPRAHEDDAERAISAGLGVVAAVAALTLPNREPYGLAARIGIATGPVVVGDIVGEGSAQEAAVTGETPNLAARLQEIAEPNTVVIAETTRLLAGGLFSYHALGEQSLKGILDTAKVWRVEGERRVESRFAAKHDETLTPLVGRDEELELLTRRWRRARSGEGRVVLLSGEPGIGKSRLVHALAERLEGEPHRILRIQCSPHHSSSAMHPFVEHLEGVIGFTPGDTAAVKLDKLIAWIAQADQPPKEIAPLLGPYLGIDTIERYPPIDVEPKRQKRLLLEAIAEREVRLAAKQPTLFVVEDAHWIDPTSLELLGCHVEQAPQAAVLIVVTYRPEFVAPWVGAPHVTQLTLNRLSARDCAVMVGRLTGKIALSPDVLDHLIDRADGIPLFAEELTRSVVEAAGARSNRLAQIDVPATLKDSLEARLDRLGAAKEIVQIGAAIGRRFEYRLIARVARVAEDKLRAILDELAGSGLVLVRGEPPEAIYTFKHALVQDAAYQTLLRRRRTELHQRIAEVLEGNFDGIAATEPETLAHHHTEGGNAVAAVFHWLRAGQRAAERSADVEASQHLRKALQVLEGIPEGAQRRERELEILIALGPVLMNTQGSASDEVRSVYMRARELCNQTARPAQRFPVIWGLWINHQLGGDSETALSLAHEAINIADDLSDRDLLLQAHHSAWTSQALLGDFSSVLQHADQGLALYEVERHRAHIFTYGGHDAGVCGGALSSHAAWFLGFPDQALKRSRESLALARRTAHPFSIAHALNFAAMLRLLRREFEEAAQISDELIAFSTENGLAIWRANGAVLRGWARSLAWQSAQELEDFREAVRQRKKSGSRMRLSIHLAALAHALSVRGHDAEARKVIGQALREVDETGDRWWEALIHWLNGEILASGSGASDEQTAACYRRACDVARRQQARTMELRALTSLARLAFKQGKKRDSYDLLAPVYSWFTEGFDTPDLKEAKALLAELA